MITMANPADTHRWKREKQRDAGGFRKLHA
jgi:hypothetical protein